MVTGFLGPGWWCLAGGVGESFIYCFWKFILTLLLGFIGYSYWVFLGFLGFVRLGYVCLMFFSFPVAHAPTTGAGGPTTATEVQHGPAELSCLVWPHGPVGPVSLSPIGSMYGIYGNIYHQYTPNVSIYTIHGSYGIMTYLNWSWHFFITRNSKALEMRTTSIAVRSLQSRFRSIRSYCTRRVNLVKNENSAYVGSAMDWILGGSTNLPKHDPPNDCLMIAGQ